MSSRTFPSRLLFCLFTSLALLALTGCGGVLSSRRSGFSVRDAHAVDDLSEAALAALIEARPSVHDGYRVAWLAVAPGHEEALATSLEGLPGQRDAHRLSPLVAVGRRRFEEGSESEISIGTLRLLAARAHADVLVVVDHGWRSSRAPNGWAALSVLLLPTLFTPHLDADVETYVEATAIDVRSGAILGETSTTGTLRVSNMTVWSTDDEDRAEAQIDSLFETTRTQLVEVLSGARTAGREG
jgi:hypothetical protein